MKFLDGLFGRLWTARRWVGGQFYGMLLLILAALAWTRLPDKHGWQIVFSLLIPLLLVISALELQAGTVRKLADEAISALSSVAAKRGIALANECEDAFIAADESRLNQVLLNFISNALKFSPDNSAISLVSKHDANFVRIGVRDQGPGLDKKAAARVFDKFFQAEGLKKREGFGLGLAICKLIVESHGGSVSVESKPGKGCTFWMTLPYEG